MNDKQAAPRIVAGNVQPITFDRPNALRKPHPARPGIQPGFDPADQWGPETPKKERPIKLQFTLLPKTFTRETEKLSEERFQGPQHEQ